MARWVIRLWAGAGIVFIAGAVAALVVGSVDLAVLVGALGLIMLGLALDGGRHHRRRLAPDPAPLPGHLLDRAAHAEARARQLIGEGKTEEARAVLSAAARELRDLAPGSGDHPAMMKRAAELEALSGGETQRKVPD